MASTNLKRVVSKAIANYLAANVTGLSNVSSKQEGPEKDTIFPSAMLETGSFRFVPEDPDEVYWFGEDTDDDADDGKLVLSVGEFEGQAELRLYAKNVPERELYEQRIMDLFLAQQGSPGTLYITTPTLTVNGYVSLHSVEIKLRLESEEWQEEFAFENRRYSFIDVSFAYPALTTRDAAEIESLQLALAGLTGDAEETIEVQEDGSVVEAP